MSATVPDQHSFLEEQKRSEIPDGDIQSQQDEVRSTRSNATHAEKRDTSPIEEHPIDISQKIAENGNQLIPESQFEQESTSDALEDVEMPNSQDTDTSDAPLSDQREWSSLLNASKTEGDAIQEIRNHESESRPMEIDDDKGVTSYEELHNSPDYLKSVHSNHQMPELTQSNNFTDRKSNSNLNGQGHTEELVGVDGDDNQKGDKEEEDVDNNNEDDDDEDEDEDDEPPKLKYSRLTGLPPTFFERDPISACYFHENLFIFATHSGVLHLAHPDLSPIRTFRAHRASVLSIHTDGQYFATGSMDGTVVIGSITDTEDIVAFDFKRPIHAVVLDRNYKLTKSFISGGMAGKVVLSQRNWLRQRVDTVLQENKGPIVSIQMIDDLVMWMNDEGISVYHVTTRNLLINVKRPEGASRADLYWPRVHFPETDRILIAWGDHIWSLRASLINPDHHFSLSSAASSFRASQEKKIEVENVFKLDCLVSGIASFKDDLWMILTYTPPARSKKGMKFFPPELKLINSINGEEVHDEEIGLKSFDNLGLNDYHLGQHIGDKSNKYFLISAKDAVIAQEFDLNDQLNWYISKEKYFEAWNMSKNLSTPEKRLVLGVKHVDHLIKQDLWDEAASFLNSVLQLDEDELSQDTEASLSDIQKSVLEEWETWVWIFIHSNHTPNITRYIPTYPKFRLKSDTYDSVLSYWLENDEAVFLKLMNEWDIELYDLKSMQSTLEDKLESEENSELRRCLAGLYVKSHEPASAVPHLMKLKDPSLFEFLSHYHLLKNFFDDVPQILQSVLTKEELEFSPISQLQEKLADIVKLLIDHRHEISPGSVIKLMDENHLDFINYFYLDGLSEIDNFLAKPFEDEIIKLYSLYNRELLLPFLSKNNDYDIQKAISICETSEFIEELVYLLGKVGQNKKALLLIIDKVEDPEMAINFTKNQKDKELWEYLLDYSMSKPAFIRSLIECAEDSIDPIAIIKRIPEDIEIEGLKDSIANISANNDLTLILNELILRSIYNETIKYSEMCKELRTKGLLYEESEYETIFEKFEPSIRFYNEKKLITESEAVGKENIWKHNAKTLPQKSTHLAYIKERLKTKKMNGVKS